MLVGTIPDRGWVERKTGEVRPRMGSGGAFAAFECGVCERFDGDPVVDRAEEEGA